MNKKICEKCDCGDCALFFYTTPKGQFVCDCYSEKVCRELFDKEKESDKPTDEELHERYGRVTERMALIYKSFDQFSTKKFYLFVYKTNGSFNAYGQVGDAVEMDDEKWKEYGLEKYTGIPWDRGIVSCPYEMEHVVSALNVEKEE